MALLTDEKCADKSYASHDGRDKKGEVVVPSIVKYDASQISPQSSPNHVDGCYKPGYEANVGNTVERTDERWSEGSGNEQCEPEPQGEDPERSTL